MTIALRPLSVGSSSSDTAPQEASTSPSNPLVQSFEARFGLGVEPEGFREWFVPTFARWLQSNFARPEQVAASFNVTYQTSLNWWNGRSRATGDVIGLVFMSFPAAVGWFLAEWERR